MPSDELHIYRGRGDGINEPPYDHYDPAGFTLADVRRLVREYSVASALLGWETEDPHRSALAPFASLLKENKDAP